MKSLSQYIKPIVFIIFIAVAAIVIIKYKHFLSLEYVKNQIGILQYQIQKHPLIAIASYFMVYVIATALSVPGAVVLTLLGGALFGLVKGTIIVSFASTIGATIAFIIGRFLLRDSIENKFPEQYNKINAGIQKDGMLYLFALRLVPVFPFFIINLLMGLTRIPTLVYMGVSQLGMLPGTIVYVNTGRALATLENLSDILSPQLWGAFALLAILPFVSKTMIRTVQAKKLYKKYKKPKSYDANITVIGAGSGGLVASYVASTIKAKTILIEKHRMGGDCLNYGCVPSKALISISKIADAFHKGKKVGITYEPPTISFKKVMENVRSAVANVAPHDSIERYTKLGVECIQDTATILSPWEVQVGDKTITTRSIVIATGGSPIVPNIPGIEKIKPLTSENIWNITQLPKQFLIIGGGPIGCEMALAFAKLGSHVTVVQRASQLLPKEDVEVGTVAYKVLTQHGVTVLTDTSPESIKITNKKKQAVVKTSSNGVIHTIVFDQVLFAVGRKANTTAMGLEELGIECNDNGTLVVNDYLQTAMPNIYAVGDVVGPYQFTHIAGHMGWHAAVNALLGGIKRFAIDYHHVPSVTFLSPEIARVGLNEKEAKVRGIPYEVTTYHMDELDRAIAERATEGFIKILTPPKKDTILGATVITERAGEILGEFIIAKKHKIGLNNILRTIHPYPTFIESVKATAGSWKKARAPQKILNIMEKIFRLLLHEH